ncbi:hypothetical protein ECFRIK1999_5829, partial [Escherichia coli FRIK1999]
FQISDYIYLLKSSRFLLSGQLDLKVLFSYNFQHYQNHY